MVEYSSISLCMWVSAHLQGRKLCVVYEGVCVSISCAQQHCNEVQLEDDSQHSSYVGRCTNLGQWCVVSV